MTTEKITACFELLLLLLLLNIPAVSSSDTIGSVFLPSRLIKQVRKNAVKNPQVAAMKDEIVAAAKPWLSFSDNQLWEMMFGSTIKRSWMVWSNGYCPSCRKSVPMYTWVMEPFEHPWKTRCPHCKEQFPKNDFERFYRSGLDSHYVFDPQKADRTLLFNTEHPDPNDPLHMFGVDDGEGYEAEGHRWRFIGAYLIYGHWKQLIQAGIVKLAAAYTVTGDNAYAHRAGVLLDRVADIYPSHDFGKQGVMYEGAPRSGYISTWHDACIETRQMAFAYDMVREALTKDIPLAVFLTEKAKRYNITISKSSPADVLKNIENGILRHPQQNLDRIYCNYPQTEMTVAILKSVLNEPGNREQVLSILDDVIEKSTAIDGVTGEKGLTGYAVFATSYIATVLATYGRADPSFLKELVHRHPRLIEMFRFYIDVWCGQRYYPHIGDCAGFATPDPGYVAVAFTQHPGIGPSMYTFLQQLTEITADPVFTQVLYKANDSKTSGLPYDMFAVNPEKFQQRVASLIEKNGVAPKAISVNKTEWHLAILKDGAAEKQRALWLDYDSGGYHSHSDGLNIGLFAFGLDLLPDFGYPPVQFGGWGAPRARWYTMTAAHNTVVVDGRNQINLAKSYPERSGFKGLPAGKTSMWGNGNTVRIVRAEAPNVYDIARYERTVAMADVSDKEFYVFDIFRVKGGNDHARMTYSGFGSVTTEGLNMSSAPEYGYDTQLRNFRTDTAPNPGWSADWKIEDRYSQRLPGENVHLRLTDLTQAAEASLAEAWISAGRGDDGEWIPGVMTRRRTDKGELHSDFVGIIQPYLDHPFITSSHRLPSPAGSVAAEIRLQDGRRDNWMATDSSSVNHTINIGEDLQFKGDFAFVRRGADGKLLALAIHDGGTLRVGGWEFEFVSKAGFIEIVIEDGGAALSSGSRNSVVKIKHDGRAVRLRVRK